MPWHISNEHADCEGWAVVKDDDNTVAGCHPSEERAKRQLAALYVSEGKAIVDTDTVIYQGGAVKALEGGKVGGYLVLFSSDTDPDLVGDFFTAETDFGSHKTAPVLYQHGLDRTIKRRRLGSATLAPDDVGVWVEAQLELRDEYEREIYQMAEAGKLGWSSGTAAHLVEREPAGKAQRVTAWPLGLDASLTPTPAEPRTQAIALKTLVEPDPEVDGAEAASKTADAEAVVGPDIRKLSLQIEQLELEYEYQRTA